MNKVVIWGCGSYGEYFYKKSHLDYDILAFTDSDQTKWYKQLFDRKILPPDKMLSLDFDYVFVAISRPFVYDDILEYLKNNGVPEEKVVDVTCATEYMDYFIDRRIEYIRSYSRFIYDNNVAGNVAECGVYLGNSARHINRYFSDKIMYLFDTFEGFNSKDIQIENKFGNDSFKNGRFSEEGVFNNTSIEYVIRKMPYKDKIVIKKGYFPESANDISDTFCFVNLDMDLYEPMINGLRFFWDKMEKGGCILLHDYYHGSLPGVKKAVDDFEKELGYKICKTPIGDNLSIALLKGGI